MTTYADRPHILIVDDDERIRDLVARYLTQQGMLAVTAEDGEQAEKILESCQMDLLVLDVMMPGMSGLDLTRKIRMAGGKIPVLLLTAKGEAEDRIEGLEVGADDYLSKPFEPRELVLRIHAILKRTEARKKADGQFRLGEWKIDLDREEMSAGEEVMPLTAVEHRLLSAFAQHPGQVVSRETLATLCRLDPAERTLDVQITRLRRKLQDDPRDPQLIRTVRGQGYMMNIYKENQ